MSTFYRPVDAGHSSAASSFSEDAAINRLNDIVALASSTSVDGSSNGAPYLRRGNVVYRHHTKRLLDLVLSVMMIPVVVPLVALLALIVASDGKNPFYSQMRVGKHGVSFRMWKLRTMLPNAEKLLEIHLENNPEAKAEWDKNQKLKNDPRVTKVGRFLRKTSLDELSQLVNVLNGTMSLVGPRPIMECQRDVYAGSSYFNLSPGITGLWQISDRNKCQFTERVYFDDLYEKNLSLRIDLTVLFRTIGVVVRGTGH